MTEIIADLNDDQILRYVQNKRKALVDTISEKGIPEDNESRNTMLRALEGMASSALSSKKTKNDKELNVEMARANATIAAIFTKMGNVNPYQNNTENGNMPVVPEVLDADYKEVDGNDFIGVENEDYKSFAAKNGLLK